jgi:hypothetical protein
MVVEKVEKLEMMLAEMLAELLDVMMELLRVVSLVEMSAVVLVIPWVEK